jgi:hypothetical protein
MSSPSRSLHGVRGTSLHLLTLQINRRSTFILHRPVTLSLRVQFLKAVKMTMLIFYKASRYESEALPYGHSVATLLNPRGVTTVSHSYSLTVARHVTVVVAVPSTAHHPTN